MSEARPTFEGVIESKLPGGLYRVVFNRNETGKGSHALTVSLGSGARHTLVRVIPGDRVLVEVSPIDPTRGRIKARIG